MKTTKEEAAASGGFTNSHKKKKKKKVKSDMILAADKLTNCNGCKKKKKKPEKEPDRDFLPTNDEAQIHRKKRRKRKLEDEDEEEGECLTAHDKLTTGPKKKKKKKERWRRREEEQGEPVLSAEVELTDSHGKKKKKKKRKEGGEQRRVDALSCRDQLITSREENKDKEPGGDNEAESRHRKEKQRRKREEREEGDVILADDGPAEIQRKSRDGLLAEDDGAKEATSRGNGAVTMGTRVSRRDRRMTSARQEEKMEEKRTQTQRLMLELQEFLPNIEDRPTDEVEKLIKYDLQRFKAFKAQGVPLRWGRFTRQENQQILSNMADFLSLTGICSGHRLMFPKRFPEEQPLIRKLRVRHGLYLRLAEGVPRPCRQVYIRAKKMVDEWHSLGRFSEDELNSLRRLHHLHGNNWVKISGLMNRSVHALQKRFVCLDSDHGPWQPDEESRLLSALQEHLRPLAVSSGGALTLQQLCGNLPWGQISQRVRTRTWNQCRYKWSGLLRKRLSSVAGECGGRAESCGLKIRLIRTLDSKCVEDPADIDWEDVARAVGNVTPYFVQKMFNRLKVSKVPHWRGKSFEEIMSFLQQHLLPLLQQSELESNQTHIQTPEQTQPARYSLSDVFGSPCAEAEPSDPVSQHAGTEPSDSVALRKRSKVRTSS